MRGCVPVLGAGQSPWPHKDFQGGIGPLLGLEKSARRFGGAEQEKALTLFCVQAATTTRSAGGSGDWADAFSGSRMWV